MNRNYKIAEYYWGEGPLCGVCHEKLRNHWRSQPCTEEVDKCIVCDSCGRSGQHCVLKVERDLGVVAICEACI